MSNLSQRGFTLIEVIVVLVIGSLIAAVLMQGLSLVLDTRLRVQNALLNASDLALRKSILTTPLRGVLPDYIDGPDRFIGEQRRMRGLTLSPLQGTVGAPTGFGMVLNYEVGSDQTSLIYFERGFDSVTLAQWPGDTGEFLYRGKSGEWTPGWPVPGDLIERAPRSIRVKTGLFPAEYVVLVMGSIDRVGRIQDSPISSAQ